jgi:hypothetical protein
MDNASESSQKARKRYTNDWIARQRFEHGLCHECGNQIYNILEDSKQQKIYEPITMEGFVANGRCLLCYPISISSKKRRSQSSRYSEEGISDEGSTLLTKSIVTTSGNLKQDDTDDSTFSTTSTTAQSQKFIQNYQLQSQPVEQDCRLKENMTEETQNCRMISPLKMTHKIQDADGLEFFGTILEGTREQGRGKFCYGEGSKLMIYEGEFQNGYFHGQGISQDHGAGCSYEGEFLRGAAHGKGRCKWDQGWEYVGEWRMDKRHGRGKCRQLVDHGGEVYDGEWKDDKWDGHGVLLFAGGGKYTGSFRRDKLHGQGTYEFADGSVYCGSFQNDLRHGHGEMTYVDGLRYVGEWLDNWRNGKGTIFYSDGSTFRGKFNEDEKDGTGYLHLPDGILRKETYRMGALVQLE